MMSIVLVGLSLAGPVALYPSPDSYIDQRQTAFRRAQANNALPSAALVARVRHKLVQSRVVEAGKCWSVRYAYDLDESLKLSGRRIAFRAMPCGHGHVRDEVVPFGDFPELWDHHKDPLYSGYYDVSSDTLYQQL